MHPRELVLAELRLVKRAGKINVLSSITQPRIVGFYWNLVQRLTTSQQIQHKCRRSKGQRSRSAQRMVLAVKRYKTGTDRLTNFKLGMGLVMKAVNSCCEVERPRVTVRNLPHFIVTVNHLFVLFLTTLFSSLGRYSAEPTITVVICIV